MIDALLDALLDAMFDPWPPLTFCCPQASRSGRRSFDSKLISLPPLDEVPVHVYRFAARVPCDSKGSECQCGIHTAEAASALRSRKTETAAKEKPTPISHIFFSTCCAMPSNTASPAGGACPTPPRWSPGSAVFDRSARYGTSSDERASRR